LNNMRNVSSKGMEIIDLFIDSLRGRNLNSRTIQEYAADLKHFMGWHEYQGMETCQNVLIFSFDQITLKELVTYKEAMKKVDLKPSTINRRLSTIKLLFHWAHHHGFVRKDSSKHIKLLPLPKSPPHMINNEEEKRLLDAVKAHGNLRDQVILKLMIFTGIRAGEICNLKVVDVKTFQKSGVIIVGAENQRRKVPLNNMCKSILEKYMATNTNYLFLSKKTGERLTERALRHLVKKYLDIAGLEGLSAYSLRHNFGYRKAAKTSMHKLARIMGHNSLNTTMTYFK